VQKEGGHLEVVAPKIGGAKANGKRLPADHALASGPSILFDAVVVAATGDGADRLAEHPTAIDRLRDAFAHLKVIGHVPGAGATPSARRDRAWRRYHTADERSRPCWLHQRCEGATHLETRGRTRAAVHRQDRPYGPGARERVDAQARVVICSGYVATP